MCKRSRHIWAKISVSQEQDDYRYNGRPHNTSCCFQYHYNSQKSNDKVGCRYRTCAKNKTLIIYQNINRWNGCKNSKPQIQRVNLTTPNPCLLRWAKQEYQGYAKTQMNTALNHGIKCAEEPGINLKQGKTNTQRSNQLSPYTGIFHGSRFLIQTLKLFIYGLCVHGIVHMLFIHFIQLLLLSESFFFKQPLIQGTYVNI